MRKTKLKEQITSEFDKMIYKNHVAINGLTAYQERLKFLIQVKPVRDVDAIKINELSEHAIEKADIDIRTVADFSIKDS